MLKDAIRLDPDPDDYKDEYEQMLDECYGQFMDMDASYILKECDPTAYHCGLNDYVSEYGQDQFECPICRCIWDDEEEALYCCQEE